MPAFVLEFDKNTRLLLDVVSFPPDHGYAAAFVSDERARATPDHVEVRAFAAASVEDLRCATHYFSRHDAESLPVPTRDASPEELEINSVDADLARAL
jgi:hypothetical protein